MKEVLLSDHFDSDGYIEAVAFNQPGRTLGTDDSRLFVGGRWSSRHRIFGVLDDFNAKLGSLPGKSLDFVIADQFEAFTFVFGQIDDAFTARQMFGEFTIRFARRFGLAVLLFVVTDDLLSFADRVFDRTDDLRRGFFTEVQEQLSFAIDSAFALAAKELSQQLLDLQVQFGVFFAEFVIDRFDFQHRMSLLGELLVLSLQCDCLFLNRNGLFLDLLSQRCDQRGGGIGIVSKCFGIHDGDIIKTAFKRPRRMSAKRSGMTKIPSSCRVVSGSLEKRVYAAIRFRLTRAEAKSTPPSHFASSTASIVTWV